MGSDLNVCGKVLIFFLVILNILFAVLGIILIGVGSWLISIDDNYSFITGSGVISGAALLIIAGIVTVIICVTGIIGAIFKWRPILLVYAFVVAVIVILEIIAGILGFLLRDNVVEVVNRQGMEAISLYNPNVDDATPDEQDATQVVDFIQNTLGCCGYNNASDWINLNPRALFEGGSSVPVPPGYNNEDDGCAQCNPADEGCATFMGEVTVPNTSINRTVTFNVTTTGCINAVQDNIILFASVTGAIGIVFGILEISGVLLALFLCCCITSARKQEVV